MTHPEQSQFSTPLYLIYRKHVSSERNQFYTSKFPTIIKNELTKSDEYIDGIDYSDRMYPSYPVENMKYNYMERQKEIIHYYNLAPITRITMVPKK